MNDRVCPECGATLNDEVDVCPECGFKLSNEKGREVETVSGNTNKTCNLLLEVPYRFDFNKGWKNVFDWFLSFGWLIGVALIIVGVIIYSVAGAKSAGDPLEVLAKAVDIADAHDTVKILVTVGLVVVLVQMLGDATKDVYLRIFYGKWLSKRKEQAIETILKYDVATASAKENDFVKSFANATYYAHNPKEYRKTVLEFIIYVAVVLFAMISTILLGKECVDLVGVKLLKKLNNEEYDIFDNLPTVLTIVCAVAWVVHFLVKKFCEKSNEKKYIQWANEVGISLDL